MFHQKGCIYGLVYGLVYGRSSIMKTIRPMICQKLFAGFATDTSSTTTEFQRSLPTKPRITNARRNAKRIERNSTYASRFLSESLPFVIDSIAAPQSSRNAIL